MYEDKIAEYRAQAAKAESASADGKMNESSWLMI